MSTLLHVFERYAPTRLLNTRLHVWLIQRHMLGLYRAALRRRQS